MEFNIILKWPRLSVPLNRIHTRYIVKVPRSACIHMKKKNAISYQLWLYIMTGLCSLTALESP